MLLRRIAKHRNSNTKKRAPVDMWNGLGWQPGICGMKSWPGNILQQAVLLQSTVFLTPVSYSTIKDNVQYNV